MEHNATEIAMASLSAGDINATPERVCADAQRLRDSAILPDSRSLNKADGHERHLMKTMSALTRELRFLQMQRGVTTVLQVEIVETVNPQNESV